MNTVHHITPLGRFKWLLRREYWENRGGFFWAQVITGGIAILFSAMGAGIGAMVARKAQAAGAITRIDTPGDYAHAMGAAGDGLLLTGILLASVVLAFVVFFYALGSLYDDRRDRSILFWKSLPVSDLQTVLSKVVWALLLAPLVAIVVGIAVGLCLWLVAILGSVAAGVPSPWTMATHSRPLRIVGQVLSAVPVTLLWSLPTVGWLMLCSAWARSKPFLWAVLVPLLGCVMVSILGAMPGVKLPLGWVWYVVGYRGLLSVFPGTWVVHGLNGAQGDTAGFSNPGELVQSLLQHRNLVNVVTGPDIWIGALVGVAFIAAAIWLRRRREDA
ncbi:ABC transporter permease [Stenotrophomonas mori]|uniref:ABC transporter permease n=1 Tax=Stenotrophomonas mori TaxID=2871096 RepID=A0ABT0SE59_9GAMM|nr:ABC transporter permease [Stenotrophomonas mori]MCL7713609.1 ABC transporter permease [Stenotrophomonas mori]